MKARYGTMAEKVRELCARDIGCSLKDASAALDRPLNCASVYVMNLVKHGEVVKAGVHGEYRYFKDRQKAAEHDLVAKEARRIQVIENKKKKDARRAQAEREKRAKIRAEKGLPPYDPSVIRKPKPAKQKVLLKPRDSGLVISARQQDKDRKREHIQATITWPENVKIMKVVTLHDTRFKFVPPPGWKGEFSREWEERRSA